MIVFTGLVVAGYINDDDLRPRLIDATEHVLIVFLQIEADSGKHNRKP